MYIEFKDRALGGPAYPVRNMDVVPRVNELVSEGLFMKGGHSNILYAVTTVVYVTKTSVLVVLRRMMKKELSDFTGELEW